MSTLDNRNELISGCRHSKKFLLNTVLTWLNFYYKIKTNYSPPVFPDLTIKNPSKKTLVKLRISCIYTYFVYNKLHKKNVQRRNRGNGWTSLSCQLRQGDVIKKLHERHCHIQNNFFFNIKIFSILKLVYRRKRLRCSIISGVPVTCHCYKRKNNYDRSIWKHIVWNTSFIGADFALSLGLTQKYIIFLFL